MPNRVDPGLSRTITWIATVIGVFTALSVPGVYYFTAFDYESARIQAKAEHTADEVSEIIFANPRMWSFMGDRLSGRLAELERRERQIYRILDTEGIVVLEQGEDIGTPSVTTAAELTDGFRAVGTIQVVESLRHVWVRTGFAALLGSALGLAMFAALRVLPLRALGHAMHGLQEAHGEITKLNAGLEHKVEQRTAELRTAQDELLRKERLAALGQLTATVSHELRNPLGTIRTSLFTVEERIRDKGLGVERAIGRIERNIGRCDRIIGELLDFTRIRELVRETTKIDDWLERTLDEHALSEGIALERDLAAGVTLAFDRERLRRVLINLLDNACHAIAEGNGAGGSITVSSRVRGGRLEVSVADSGPGVSADALPKVFEPLYSTKSFGVGLGLPMVRQVLEQHGGGVEIGNRENGGARVLLWLDLDQVEKGAVA